MDDFEVRLLRAPEPLARAFAVTGCLNGMFIGDVSGALRHAFYRCGFASSLPYGHLATEARVGLGAVFGLAFFVAGAALARSLKEGERITWLASFALVFAAFIGGGVGLVVSSDALPLSLLAALVSLPWCLLTSHGATRAWDARAKTPGHRLFRRVMWLGVVGNALTLLARMARRRLESPGFVEHDAHATLALVVMSSFGASMLVATGIDLWRLRRLERDLARRTPDPAGETQHHDMGIGDGELAVTAPGKNPYRDTEKLLAHVRGDIGQVVRALRWGGAALALVLLGMVMSLGVPLGEPIACM